MLDKTVVAAATAEGDSPGGAGNSRRRRPVPRPFPLQALLDVTGMTAGLLGRVVKASGSRVEQAETCGLTVVQADVWALRCGLHPGEVWGDIWWANIDNGKVA